MIQNNIHLQPGIKRYGHGDAALTITFLVSELLQEKNDINRSFAVFLYDIKVLESYGMPVYTNLYNVDSGLQITYVLRLSNLTHLCDTINMMQDFFYNRSKYTELEFINFESDLDLYNLNLKEEIEFRYPKE